jgi:hypothetical protein
MRLLLSSGMYQRRIFGVSGNEERYNTHALAPELLRVGMEGTGIGDGKRLDDGAASVW